MRERGRLDEWEMEGKLRFEGRGNLDIKERKVSEWRGPENLKQMANVVSVTIIFRVISDVLKKRQPVPLSKYL